MLEQSAAELRATVEELEKRYDTIDNEGETFYRNHSIHTIINYMSIIFNNYSINTFTSVVCYRALFCRITSNNEVFFKLM